MFNWVLSTGNQIDFWCFFYCPKYLVLKESPFYVDARAAAYRGFLYIISRQRRKEKNMEIKNVLFAEALDAWLLCYGGKEEDVEYVGESITPPKSPTIGEACKEARNSVPC